MKPEGQSVHHVQVGEAEGVELTGRIGELFTVVWRTHVVETAVGGESYPHAADRPFGRDGLDHLCQESEAILDAAAVAVGALIRL